MTVDREKLAAAAFPSPQSWEGIEDLMAQSWDLVKSLLAAPTMVTGPNSQIWDVEGPLKRNRTYALVDVGERGDREPGTVMEFEDVLDTTQLEVDLDSTEQGKNDPLPFGPAEWLASLVNDIETTIDKEGN